MASPRLQSRWKGLCLHQGGTREEMMLLCTSFGCYSADSSKHLALGGGTDPIEMKVCPCRLQRGLKLTLSVGFEPLVGVKHVLLLGWDHPLSIWK